MTEAEARAQLESLIRDREALLDPQDPEDIYMADIEALQMAIGLLEGGAMFTEGEMAAIIRAQDELLQYRELGALEECREAVEKQKAIVPNNVKSIKFIGSMREQFKTGDCPCCNNAIDTDDDYKFCSECGQHIDWSE